MFIGAMGAAAIEEREFAVSWVMESCRRATTGLWSDAFSGDMW
jgi:hypothetical protein